MNALAWVLSNKLLSFLVIATLAFGIATIALGVDNTDLRDEIDRLKVQFTSTTTPTTTGNPTTTEETEEPSTTETPGEDMTDYKLPTNVIPESYDLYLHPDILNDGGLFTGKVSITINVLEETLVIKLHSKGLSIKSVVLDNVAVAHELDEKHELLIITPPIAIGVGAKVINIEFEGDMRNRIVGLYKSTYTNDDGTVRAMATSKFEPTYARQAFPCFDEPNMKAQFKVHLLKPKDPSYIALSNMPQEGPDEEVDDGVMVHFQTSVKMSTYLTCFIVSDFDHTEDLINETIPFRVFATKDQKAKTEYARTVGKKVIEFYNDYFSIPYPLPKLDMAAIPDFVSGAMEHWGLVTYRETALLYSPEISATSNKQRVASVVAHELAHSWFGNLVTMNWWNDLWLNEGFASYIEYKGVEFAEDGKWKMMDQFLIADVHPVLKTDATLSSHPIVQHVVTPDEITSIFDSISYNKGAAILRMLEDAVTEPIFRQGVINYLTRNAYGNAVTQDLWDELDDLVTEDVNVTQFMDTWTVQMGYPVVDVRTEGDKFILKQTRYLTDQSAVDETATPYNYKWIIPITYITDAEITTSTLVWFPYTEEEIAIAKPQNAKWVKFNYRQVGYYRVNYEEDHWRTLIDNIAKMETSDRAHLIEESFRLAGSGHLSYQIPLDLTKYLVDEEEYIPWAAASNVLDELKVLLMSSQQYTNLKLYIRSLLTKAYEKYKWGSDEDDPHLEIRARVQVLSTACGMGHPECLETAGSMFISWLDGEEAATVPQDLRSIVYSFGMANSPAEYWELLWRKFIAETDAGEKLRLLSGLASIKDTSYLTKLIEIAKTEEYIRSQDYFTCLQYISSNPIGTPIVWDYVREHWEELVERFTLNDRYLGQLIPQITRTFATNTKLDEMNAFFKKYPEAGAGTASRQQALENVANNMKWLTSNKAVVENWISKSSEI